MTYVPPVVLLYIVAPVGGGFCLLRGTILNRTYSIHKNLPGIYFPIFTNNIRSYLLWSPVVVGRLTTAGESSPFRPSKERTESVPSVYCGYNNKLTHQPRFEPQLYRFT